MTSELIQEIVRFYEQDVEWPTQTQITPRAKQLFDQGRAIIDSYTGDPDVLLEAFNTFLSTDCLPYAYAGAALVLDKAALDPDGEYDKYGLQQAKEWLEKAQELAFERFEIDLIEVSLYASSKEYQAMRLCLEYLEESLPVKYPENLRFHQAEMAYWYANYDPDKYLETYDKAMEVAQTDAERLALFKMLAGFYFKEKHTYPQALETYQEISRITPDDPWCWHNMSVIYLHQKQYDEAYECNQQALKLMDFPEARQIEKTLKKHLSP